MKIYETPAIEITRYDVKDIITVSGGIVPDIDGNSTGFLQEWLNGN